MIRMPDPCHTYRVTYERRGYTGKRYVRYMASDTRASALAAFFEMESGSVYPPCCIVIRPIGKGD